MQNKSCKCQVPRDLISWDAEWPWLPLVSAGQSACLWIYPLLIDCLFWAMVVYASLLQGKAAQPAATVRSHGYNGDVAWVLAFSQARLRILRFENLCLKNSTETSFFQWALLLAVRPTDVLKKNKQRSACLHHLPKSCFLLRFQFHWKISIEFLYQERSCVDLCWNSWILRILGEYSCSIMNGNHLNSLR